MKTITGYVRTANVLSKSNFEFEVDDDATSEEIEGMARDAAFELIDWTYTIDGESPD